MMKAVIYARFSSDKQDENSINAQVRACTEYANQHKFDIVKLYIDEAISGKGEKTTSRKEYQKMLKDTQKGLFDIILIHKYDRVARSLREHANLEKLLNDNNIRLIATAQDFGSSNEAKIIKSMMWALSEYYLDNLSNEVKKGLKETALKGLHNGGYAPFGYDIVDQKYVINDIESYYVKKMFHCALNKEGFTNLIEEMDLRGIRGKRGKQIKYTSIYEILRNEKYTGTYIFSPSEEKKRTDRRLKPNSIKIENAIPQIIEKDLFEEVQKIMNDRKQTGSKSESMCRGLVYCTCGAKMHAVTTHRKGHEYKNYYCPKKCGMGMVSMEFVDGEAKEYLKKLLSQENQIKIAQAMKDYSFGENARIIEFNKTINHEIEKRQQKIDGYFDTLSNGGLPSEIISDIGLKIQQLKKEIESLKEEKPPQDFTVNQIKSWLEAIKKAPDDKAINLLISRIDIKSKTSLSIKSTLSEVVGKIGCGGQI